MSGTGLKHLRKGGNSQPAAGTGCGSQKDEALFLDGEVFLVFDKDGRCIFINPAVQALLRISDKNLSSLSKDVQHRQAVHLRIGENDSSSVLLTTKFNESLWNDKSVYIARLEDTTISPINNTSQENETRQTDLFQAVYGLSNCLDIDEILQFVLIQTAGNFHTPHGFIFMVDEHETQKLKLKASKGAVFENLPPACLVEKMGEGLAGKIWQSGKALIINDYPLWQDRSTRLVEAGLRSFMGVPIWCDDKITGILGLAYDAPDMRFKQQDIEQLNHYAHLLSSAIKNMRQIDQMQYEMASHEAFEIRLRMQSRLLAGAAGALKSLIVSQNINQAVSEALSHLGEASMADYIYIFENLQKKDDSELSLGKRFEWHRKTGIIQETDPETCAIPYDPYMIDWKARLESGSMVICSGEDISKINHTVLSFCHVQSLMLVPILIGDHFWGIMGFGDEHPGREWQQEDYSILAAAAAGLGTVIEHRMVEDVLIATEERFKAFMDNSPLLVYIMDEGGRYLFINEQLRRIYNLPEDSVVGRTAEELFPPDTVQHFRNGEQEVLQKGSTQDLEYELTLPDGSNRHWRELKFPVDGPGGLRYIGGIIQDVTERIFSQDELKRWASELERRNRELAMLSQMNKFLQACTRPEAAYSVLVEYARHLFPNVSGVLLMHTEDGTRLYPAAWWGEDIDSELSIDIEECAIFKKEKMHQQNGVDFTNDIDKCAAFPWSSAKERLCLPILAQEQAFGQAQVVGVMCMWNNQPDHFIYENQRQLAMTLSEQIGLTLSNLNLSTRLRQQAIRDPLTGLFNRRYLYETLERELKRSERDGQQTSVLLIDLDHFKKINDNYGHATGDEALRHIGGILRQSVRGSDIACRYGGEEFVLALLNAGLDDAVNRANQILSMVRQLSMKIENDTPIKITVSIGVAAFPQHGSTTDAILMAADAAMYSAKQQGRNRVVIAEDATGVEK